MSRKPQDESASVSPGDASDTDGNVSALRDIARAGLAGAASPEAMLWDDLDLDDPEDCRYGDYELRERLGRGGMGVVFRAHQLSLGRDVAVKFIVGSLADNPRAVARFLAEARAAARLHHPHIVPVFEVGSVDGMHFFSMPLLRGQTLAERMADGCLGLADCVSLLRKLGAAVEYAHSLGLLHLDLKPANVLFDEHGEPLIGDFGLARHMDAAGGVDVQELSGTPAYMAPEQRGAGPWRLDERTDLYALGAILHELLSGMPPQAQDESGNASLPPPRTDRVALRRSDASLAADLAAICLKCLQPDPFRRYARVAELNADLARCGDGNEVSVRRPRWAERIARSLRRHPALSLAIAVALAAMLVGLMATSSQWRRAEQARAEADRQQTLATAQANHLRQLAGLMAAAFPAGDTAAAERSASARAAVAWLKQHAAGDPAAQRVVLTAFREALSAAGKADAVAALLREIVDQLGVDYREQQIRRLAGLGDRDSLIAAVLIGIPRAADAVPASYEPVLQRLAAAQADDELALYVAALACQVQPQPCASPAFAARLRAQFPDNAVHWVLRPSAEPATEARIAADLLQASRARDFDDRLSPMTALLRSALRDQQVPDSLLQPMQAVLEQEDVAPSLQRNAVDSVALPIYADVVRICRPERIAALGLTGLREACVAFAQKGMQSPGASILARMIGSAILRRLCKGTPLETQAREYRRQYVWLSQFAVADGSARAAADDTDQLQQDIVRYGEWAAWQRRAERAGATAIPPPDWRPADPRLLLLPEERTRLPAARSD